MHFNNRVIGEDSSIDDEEIALADGVVNRGAYWKLFQGIACRRWLCGSQKRELCDSKTRW
jgi:hypothetical protein